MSMGSRIHQARTRKGLTQEALAEQIGVTKGAIANYENSVSFPKVDILFKLFEALEVDANFLYQDYVVFDDTSRLSVEEISLLMDYRLITPNGKRLIRAVMNEELKRTREEASRLQEPVSMVVYNFPAAAGVPMWAEDDSYERLTFPADKVPKGADFGIRISGNSMEPTIPADSIVFVRKVADLRSGDIGIFMVDDEAVCKRFSSGKRGIVLKADNHEYQDIVIKDFQRFSITGKVLGYK